ncbi:hypothetical protein RHGRI_012937 [Rhododendron griersonianum]|uniref:RING-type domain-containing protein n=1 Tax=Rhododendron griersonianum TaxID=479676 RepID=A0AAV6K3N4_9ERIC|nr:hypothetical protein RHGRI_012937 [Rhododendron griersonianum]
MDNSDLPKSQVRQSGEAVPHVASRRVLKARLAGLLTCPLCNGIFKEATTINECMHTFCKECIYQKVQTGGITCCPTCNVDLSHLSPEDYLRPDEAWRNVVNSYLGISPSNEQEEAPQATRPPSLAATTSESTVKQSKKKKNKNKKPRQSPNEP